MRRRLAFPFLCLLALTLWAGCSRRVDDNGVANTEPMPTSTPVPTPASEPKETAPPEPLDPALERAKELLHEMTLEEKVGQMFVARCPEDGAAEAVSEYHPGGFILFAVDFNGKTAEQISADIQSYQDASLIPMLICVDEEGGAVNRVSTNPLLRSEPFKAPQALFSQGGWDAIIDDTREKCELLHSLGINVNFAPVCDVSTDPGDYMYNRAFGRNAALTSEYVRTVVKVMAEYGVGSVLKHFPGYGSAADTHTGIAYDNRGHDTFVNSDFIPFKVGIAAGADAVLVSHNIVGCMDAERPASLSEPVHDILRGELGFDGVVITDELSMGAVTGYANEADVAVQAVLAGNDLLCCTDFRTQIPAVVHAVKDGVISRASINDSVIRILLWKLKLGILE